METEAEYWKKVATWLADCHAATMEYEGNLKRTSESSRSRMITICEHATAMLSGVWPAGCRDGADELRVINRLRRVCIPRKKA